MKIDYKNDISVTDFNHLRKACNFTEIDEKQALTGIQNSAFILSAVHEGKTVGITRVIRDGGYVVLIADVLVLPEYQRKGIGKAMMEKAMKYINDSLKEGQRVMINLMAAEGKEPFYAQFGFTIRPHERLGAGMSQWLSK